MAEDFEKIIERRLLEIDKEIEQVSILIKVNNLLLSRFILQLSYLQKDLRTPNRNVFFKFELLQEDYQELINQFGKQEVDKVLYRLDRMLMLNKMNCPNNIKKFVIKKLSKKQSDVGDG